MADWGMPGISGMTANGIYNYMNEKIMQKDMHEGIKSIGEAILRHRESSKTAVICEDREMSYSRLCGAVSCSAATSCAMRACGLPGD